MIFTPAKAKIKLQILATPIGNLDEVSSRFLLAIKNCQCILCEDTRITSKLLNKFKILGKELISYQKFNENSKLDLAIKKIKTKKTILVSDAGYPCLSDPGYLLVKECYKNNIAIEVINGSCSIIHALVVSGLNLDNFYFNGFLPSTKSKRILKLKELAKLNNIPIVFFESVHRIKQVLKDMFEVFNNPYFVVCRELTKINETIYFGYYNEVINEIIEKGEFIIILKMNQKKQLEINLSDNEIFIKVSKLLSTSGLPLKVVCKQLGLQLKKKPSLIYNIYNKIKAKK